MDKEARRQAVLRYKERNSDPGIYAVRSTRDARVWIGRANDVGTIWNRLWFTLRQGAYPHRSLQQAWNNCGAEAFQFEVLEILDEKDLQYSRDRVLKERLEYWLAKLDGVRI
ncbi:hypothetical protein MB02_13330 [Croceicoccus estronivorus]|uniref:GIY-YIG nuclease family protein n=1 Tax=Croceicoccus estronivorus TaxID=1172626 RepID=UPI00082D6F65|nr:GIY-YIG nuclease family protein [Croceicoccus estronivorus]OCC23141.1 hypothetical protein MB02_13330 [Croceicoccus estronivorus]